MREVLARRGLEDLTPPHKPNQKLGRLVILELTEDPRRIPADRDSEYTTNALADRRETAWERLERVGLVLLQLPPTIGGATPRRGFRRLTLPPPFPFLGIRGKPRQRSEDGGHPAASEATARGRKARSTDPLTWRASPQAGHRAGRRHVRGPNMIGTLSKRRREKEFGGRPASSSPGIVATPQRALFWRPGRSPLTCCQSNSTNMIGWSASYSPAPLGKVLCLPRSRNVAPRLELPL